MKLLFLSLFLVIGIGTYAQKSTDDYDVLTSLEQFNPKENENTLSTVQRPWWQTVINVCTVVVADCGGAYAGVQGTIGLAGAVGLATGGTGVAVVAGVAGVIGAAGASNGAYHGLHRNNPNDQIGYGKLNISLPEKYNMFTNFGIHHNQVIHNNYFNNEPLTNYYNSILDNEQKKIIESKEVSSTTEYLQSLGNSYILNNGDISFLTTSLKQKGLMTEIGEKIFIGFFKKYKECSSPKDMENLINLAIDKVSNSKILDEKEKQSLIAALMTASQSPFYFNPEK